MDRIEERLRELIAEIRSTAGKWSPEREAEVRQKEGGES